MRVVVLIGSPGILTLAACTARVTPPKIEVESSPAVEIDVGTDTGRFCPPGQARKGRC